jgi:MFS family permease
MDVDMNRRPDMDDHELERRLDQAIDALGAERAPDDHGDRELAELIDTARVVRRLREPEYPSKDYPAGLAARLADDLGMPDRQPVMSGNGRDPDAAGRPLMLPRRRLLLAVAALVRVLGAGVVAGMIAGFIAGGIGGRVAMRVSGILFLRENPDAVSITDSSGRIVGTFTWSGTLALLQEGMLTGLLGGILFIVVRRWLPRSAAWRGLVFGLFLLATAGTLVIDPNNPDFTVLGPAWLNVAMYALLYLTFGMLIVPLAERLIGLAAGDQPTMAERVSRWRAVAARALLLPGLLGALLATVFVIGVTATVFSRMFDTFTGSSGVPALLPVLLAFLVVAVLPAIALLAAYVDSPFSGDDRSDAALRATITRLGRAVLLICLIGGVLLTTSAFITILTSGIF